MSDVSENRTAFVENSGPHPWCRYVAIGDSFTEGIGDPEPASPGGHRGWADRVAEVLAAQVDDFAYANLAVRGRLIGQIVAEQVECVSTKDAEVNSEKSDGPQGRRD